MNSIRLGACYLKGGMSCLSCHAMHGGKKWALRWREENDDRQCLQCHEELGPEPALMTAHSHHKDVRCVDCHMPKLLTGVLHFIRDHSIGSPEPELTERFGAALVRALPDVRPERAAILLQLSVGLLVHW